MALQANHGFVMTLKEWLCNTGTSARAFAETVGVNRATVYKLAARKTMPRPALVRRIEAATNGCVTVAQLQPI